MSLDLRTRVDRPVELIDPAAFFERDLPAAAEAGRDRLAPAVRWMRPAPLTVACDGGRWVLGATDDGRITGARVPGPDRADPPGVALSLSAGQLTDLAVDRATPVAWFGDGTLGRGVPVEHVLDWWVLLRAALDGRTPHVPGAPLRPGAGAPPPGRRAFRPDDDPAEQRRWLDDQGHLHIAGLFGAEEMAEVSAGLDAAAPSYTPGDGDSWWAGGDGSERLVRMQRLEERSTAAAAVLADDRLAALGRLIGQGHAPAGDGPGVEALLKVLGPRSPGVGVPWHTDCAFGRHSYDCARLTVGVSVTDGGPGAGPLEVVPGSHRALLWPVLVRPGLDLPRVELATAAGDVTVHLSCTLHRAGPPLSAGRRVLYVALELPPVERPAAQPAPAAALGD